MQRAWGSLESMGLVSRTLLVIGDVWLAALLGTCLAVIGALAGWALGDGSSFIPVRLVRLWIRLVVAPLLRSRSWCRRAGAIFVNNLAILTLLVLAGRWYAGALVGVAAVGLTLGIGLRLLAESPDVFPRAPLGSSGGGRRVRIGVALNLLEPPAIALAIGLSLGLRTVPLSEWDAWCTFAIWVVPATLVAACGEALWLGSLSCPEEVNGADDD